jgi:nucleotide-binding universal stress UspA family protein
VRCHAYLRGVSNGTLTEGHRAPLPATEAPVIVGYSGTDESHDALALTGELARLMRSPVVAVSVVTTAPLETDIRTYAAEVRKQTERLRAESKEALAGLDELEPVAVLAPSPARELDRIADERGAALVVLGSTHRGPIRRFVPGTVADRLLAGGSHPVAIAPRGFSRTEFTLDTIGVGFTGSPESLVAVAQAVALAGVSGASIELIAVDPRAPVEVAAAALGYAGLVASPRVTRQLIDRTWAAANTAVEDLVPRNVRATVSVIEDDPAAALARRSEELDLLVLGSRGYGPLSRVLMGSVSSAVLRASACPLIVTPRPDRVPASAEPQRSPAEVISALMTAPMNQSTERSKEEARP